MTALVKANVLSLSIPERLQLVEDIWDTIAEVPEEVSLTDEQKVEFDRRLDAYHLNPNEGSPWGVVRERILSRRCADVSSFAQKPKRK
jgi:putative addiction module component (TIGR02574 family)